MPATSQQSRNDSPLRISPLDSPDSLQTQRINNLSHKSSKTLRAQQAPRARWSPRHSLPRHRSPGLPQLPLIPRSTNPANEPQHCREGRDWSGKESQTDVVLIQCLRTNVQDASGSSLRTKWINISQERQVFDTCQYPRALRDMLGTSYNTWPWCRFYPATACWLLVQHGQVCPFVCKPMCFAGQYCTQMVQLTRPHKTQFT